MYILFISQKQTKRGNLGPRQTLIKRLLPSTRFFLNLYSCLLLVIHYNLHSFSMVNFIGLSYESYRAL